MRAFLLAAYAKAQTADERRRIADDVQVAAYDLVPAVSWGQFTIPAAHRTSLTGLVRSSFPMFWEVSKAA